MWRRQMGKHDLSDFSVAGAEQILEEREDDVKTIQRLGLRWALSYSTFLFPKNIESQLLNVDCGLKFH